MKIIISITRKELKTKTYRDYKKDDILNVDNKYFIFINGLKTYAEKFDYPMIALKEHKMPYYIRTFVFS